MARIDSDVNIVPSILDRLLDDEPEISTEPATSRVKGFRSLERSVARDLEALLNSRQETEVEGVAHRFSRDEAGIVRGRPRRWSSGST